MEADFEWDSLSPEDIASKFEQLNGELTTALESAGDDIGQQIADDYRDNVSSDTGELEDSIDYSVEVSGSELTIFIGTDDTPKAAALEFGTAPGHFPPPSELRDWAARQLGDPDAAFPVALSISESGLEAREWLITAFEDNESWAQQRLERVPGEAFAAAGFV